MAVGLDVGGDAAPAQVPVPGVGVVVEDAFTPAASEISKVIMVSVGRGRASSLPIALEEPAKRIDQVDRGVFIQRVARRCWSAALLALRIGGANPDAVHVGRLIRRTGKSTRRSCWRRESWWADSPSLSSAYMRMAETDLAHVVDAAGLFALGLGAGQRGQQQAGQDGDDGDHHQQFNQGERAARARSSRRFHGCHVCGRTRATRSQAQTA